MLYQLYESQRALMAPFAEFASASSKLYSHPLSPFTHVPMAQRLAASFDLMHRLEKELVFVRSRLLRLLEAQELRHPEIALVLGEGHGTSSGLSPGG